MCGGGQTTTSSSSPPPDVTAAYDSLINRATSVANQPLQQYTAPLVAGFTPQQMSAFNTINSTQGIANPYINAAAQMTGQAATPITPTQFSQGQVEQYLSPYTQDVVNATQAQFNNQNAQQQQQVVGNAITHGAWGGDRSAIAQSELANQQQLAQAPVIAGLYNQGYGQALGEFNTQQNVGVGAQEATGWLGQNAAYQLGALGNEAQNTALQGAGANLEAGTLQQQLAQEELNIPYEMFQQQQGYPFQTTNFLAGITEGAGSGLGGTSSTTTPGPSTGSQVAGLGMTGLGIAGLLGFLARGGRAKGYANGGTPGLGDFDIPDLSVSVVPTTPVSGAHGAGPPPPPTVPGSDSSGIPSLQDLSALKSLFGKGGNPSPDPNMTAGLADAAALTPTGWTAPEAFAAGIEPMRRGGVAGFADGGVPDLPVGNQFGGSFTAPGRGISIPLLNVSGDGAGTPGFSIPTAPIGTNVPSAQPTGGGLSIAPTFNWSPPNPNSLPHTTVVGSGFTAPSPVAPAPSQATVDQMVQQAIAAQQRQIGQAPQDSVGHGDGGGRATGGAVLPGFALTGYDSGGLVSGEMGAGMPAGGGSPLMQGIFQRYAQLPEEKLQELSVRLPASSSQGMMVRRALQAKRANPSLGASPAQEAGLAPQGPSAPISGPMRRGGLAHYDEGGLVDTDTFGPESDPLPGYKGSRPAINPGTYFGDLAGRVGGDVAWLLNPSTLGNAVGNLFSRTPDVPEGHPIDAKSAGLDLVPSATAAELPNYAPAGSDDRHDSDMAPGSLGPVDRHDGPVPTVAPMDVDAVPIPQRKPAPPSAGLSPVAEDVPIPQRKPPVPASDNAPIPDVPEGHPTNAEEAGLTPGPSLAGAASTALNPNAGQPTQAPAEKKEAGLSLDSPWAALAVAGLGTLASRSPYAGSAIGEGGLQAVKYLENQRAAKQRDQQIAQTGEYQKGELDARKQGYDLEGKRLAQAAQQAKDRLGIEQSRLEEDQHYHQGELSVRGQEAAAAQERADQGRWTYAGPSNDPNNPGSIFYDSRTGQTKVERDLNIGPKTAAGSTTQWKYNAWLGAHPGDQQGALDYAAGHRQMSEQDIAKSAYSQAESELGHLAIPPADPRKYVTERAADIAGQIRSGFARTAPAAAAAPAQAPAARPAPTAATPAQAPAARPAAAMPPVPETLRGISGLQWSGARQQFRDPATGKIYDPVGNPVQ